MSSFCCTFALSIIQCGAYEPSANSSSWCINVTMVSVTSEQSIHAFSAVFSQSRTCLMSNKSTWIHGWMEEPDIYLAQAVHQTHALECPCIFYTIKTYTRDLYDRGFGMPFNGGLTVPQHLSQQSFATLWPTMTACWRCNIILMSAFLLIWKGNFPCVLAIQHAALLDVVLIGPVDRYLMS